jgi:hypothetical protein
MMHTLDLKFEVEHHNMFNVPFEWRKEMIAWANGKTIQLRDKQTLDKSDMTWRDWTHVDVSPNWNSPYIEFRIKPNSYSKKLGWHFRP